jgi:hypothetical protein
MFNKWYHMTIFCIASDVSMMHVITDCGISTCADCLYNVYVRCKYAGRYPETVAVTMWGLDSIKVSSNVTIL